MRPVRVDRHESEHTAWEIVHAAPAPSLAGHVLGYEGYLEHTSLAVRRRQVPFGGVPLILSFGPKISIGEDSDRSLPATYESFAAGLHDRSALTEYTGAQHGLQVNLTPIGAYAVLGVPMGELTNRVVELAELWGADAREIAGRLRDASSWQARFDLLDRFLADRLSRQPRAASPAVARAWHVMRAAEGRVAIGSLATTLDWSRKHLVTRFHAEVGLPPKRLAQVLRFQRALRALEGPGPVRWAEVAQDAGYCDQAHLNRDFRRLAGLTPTAYLARRLPGGGGVAD